MREIKFRAWNGQRMVYPEGKNGVTVIDASGDWRLGESDYDWEVHGASRYSFEKESVQELMQYTGLKDKNGREIYEGDIVKYSDQLDEGIAIIEQHKHPDIIPYLVLRYAVNSAGTGDYNFDYLHGGPSHVYEVIGNIYENQELL